MSERITDGLSGEDYLTYLGIDFKSSTGSRGPQLNVRECPACHDERWKVYLGAESGLGNCFACDRKFNIWSFASAHLDTLDKRLIAKHIDTAKKFLGITAAPKKKERVEVAVEETALELPASYALPLHDGRTLQYLTDRGITADDCKRYHLRYCDFGWHSYVKDGEKRRQKFDNRVIIPVYDLDGKLVTFQGRDITGESERKYLFPIGLPGTARFLYSGHEALARRAKEVILNEGAADVWSAQAAVDREAAASRIICIGSFGKKLSYSQDGSTSQLEAFKTLRRHGLEKVTIMWDGEAQTIVGALDAAKMLTCVGLEVSIANLPYDKDPNDAPDAVVPAWRAAKRYTPLLDTRWRLRNPYGPA